MPTPDEIEASLTVPVGMSEAVLAVRDAQDSARGDWPSPRDFPQGEAPWPAADSEVLRYLMWKAEASLEAGMDPRSAIVQLAVHAWFEGGIENYDRGRRDALTDRNRDGDGDGDAGPGLRLV